MTTHDQETTYPLEGGCACGLIRYRLETRSLISKRSFFGLERDVPEFKESYKRKEFGEMGEDDEG